MTSTNLPDPILVKEPSALRQLADELMKEPIVAVDTESNSLYAYQEQVCLIQFSTPEEDILVDPLAIEDMSPLGPLFSSPEVEKVFHAAEYDVMCMKRDFDFQFSHLFDTMLAARILGRNKTGLGSLLEAEFDVQVNKRYQRANWGQRPLPDDLLSYARLDTHYLIPLRNRLMVELKEQSRWALAAEDFERLRHANGKITENNTHDVEAECWRINGAYDLDPQNAAVLHELCKYRDQMARRMDRPLFKVIGNRSLLAIAEACPRNFSELKKLPGMSSRQVRRHGKALLSAVRRGLQAEPMAPPRSPRPEEDFLIRLDRLKNWRKRTARGMGVKSDVVLPKDLMLDIAQSGPNDRQELKRLLADSPDRLDRFGDKILDVISRA
jgi:ribonuclease D